MPDFTAGALSFPPRSIHSTGNPEFDERIRKLVADWGCTQSIEMIQEMIVTALKIGRDKLSVADLKLFNRTLKEQAIHGRIFKNLEEVRAAATAFKDRYNRDWRLEKLGFMSPLEARQARLLKRAA